MNVNRKATGHTLAEADNDRVTRVRAFVCACVSELIKVRVTESVERKLGKKFRGLQLQVNIVGSYM